ncbi:hypothetical protein B4155_3433 [Bacillus cereus]|nr:hypothetical protein B4155_3433 [Bacillus cereus]
MIFYIILFYEKVPKVLRLIHFQRVFAHFLCNYFGQSKIGQKEHYGSLAAENLK